MSKNRLSASPRPAAPYFKRFQLSAAQDQQHLISNDSECPPPKASSTLFQTIPTVRRPRPAAPYSCAERDFGVFFAYIRDFFFVFTWFSCKILNFVSEFSQYVTFRISSCNFRERKSVYVYIRDFDEFNIFFLLFAY